jgi:hypothetical protein
MSHLHTCLFLEKNGSIQVSLDSPGNVYLMNGTEYKKYLEGDEFSALGGLVKARKKVIPSPGEGTWHLVIDNDNQPESMNVALNITNGRQVFDDREIDPVREQEIQTVESMDKQVVTGDKEQQKYLKKELLKKIKEIDLEGLKFLVNQAKILAHQQEIEEANNEIIRYNEDYVIHNRVKKKKQKENEEKVLVNVEQHAENTFILVLCGTRKTLSRQELRKIVEMSHKRITDVEFAHILFEWLKVRRNDILFDARIKSPDHQIWPLLRKFLRTNYKAKK